MTRWWVNFGAPVGQFGGAAVVEAGDCWLAVAVARMAYGDAGLVGAPAVCVDPLEDDRAAKIPTDLVGRFLGESDAERARVAMGCGCDWCRIRSAP